MSSATSSYAQIAGRTKLLQAVADVSGYVVNGLESVTTVDPSTLSSGVKILGNSLLEDLGREIVVYSTVDGLHKAVYRQVLPLNGEYTEGVGGPIAPLYVKVFAANGSGVRVVRTG